MEDLAHHQKMAPIATSSKYEALDQIVDLPKGATKEQVTKAIEGHVLDTAEVMGRYERETK
ncbi:PEBP family protein [Calothrix sp. NIES-4071]|nr:PEBP family protein [Calothrix sp. NIES-4071]BAZ58334.1 PEBP family protein [Calothrix sp. NIES-4105]